MDSLSNLWYITTNHTEIVELIRLRGVQIDEQTHIDSLLRLKCDDCPIVVKTLLMLEREWNQKSSSSFRYGPSAESYMQSLRDNHIKMDSHQKQLISILQGDLPYHGNICGDLRDYLEHLGEAK